ncbi:MAG TPA: tRNA pseudouridine synthase A [Acidimicrobiales bacterium]
MAGDLVRWRLRIAYNGFGFHGFAAQNGQATVAGALCDALSRFTRSSLSLTCAGRTDTGVHAQDQVVHVDLPPTAAAGLDPDDLMRSCNRQLGPAIVVREAVPAPPGFDARRSATGRRYRYLVVNAPVPDPLLAGVTWHVSDQLDLRAMAAASDALLGEHDFRAFCRRVPGTSADDPIMRRVVDARWSVVDGSGARAGSGGRGARTLTGSPGVPGGHAALLPADGALVAFEIEANAFCHQMVRSLVGTLVDVGRGRKRASDMLWILRSADRQEASQPAPAHGLCLVAVRYGP